MNGTPVLPPVAILTTADYSTPSQLCDAINALYNEGYIYMFDVIKGSDSWVGFTGSWVKPV